MMERRLDKVRLCGLLLDATPFAGQQMVAAMGISQDGRKMILGLRQGATENATVVGELLGDLMNRGLDFSQPRLYVLDGGKALSAAVKKYAGESAPIQRCEVHKRRNVLDHLTDEQKPMAAKKLKRGVRAGRPRCRQTGVDTVAPRTDGSESQRGPKFRHLPISSHLANNNRISR